MLAGLTLCHLLGPESEPRGECYSAGIDRLQASLIFNEMEAIIHAVPSSAPTLNIQRFRKVIEVRAVMAPVRSTKRCLLTVVVQMVWRHRFGASTNWQASRIGSCSTTCKPRWVNDSALWV